MSSRQRQPVGAAPRREQPQGAGCCAVAQAEVARLQAEVAGLQAANSELQEANAKLQAGMERLQQRLDELERSLGLNSGNSGKPPSSDGPGKLPAKPRTRSTRGRSGKRSGGQPGHPGATLQRTEQPDRVAEHRPVRCDGCGGALTASDRVGPPVARQVFDLPEPQPLEATEHRAWACQCPACGHTTRARFPDGVNAPVQYGPRLAALAVYLQTAQFLPEERLAEVLRDLFGVALCTATLAAMVRQAAARWRGCTERVRDLLVSAAGVKHLDETGFRIAGRTQWLHVLSTQGLTFYRTSAQRGSLLAGLQGILVHDHWASYFTLEGVLHGLCNAHHLRELQALVEFGQEDWAARMQRLLRRANRVVRRARERGIALPRSLLERIERRYDRLVREALAYHEALPPLARGRRGRPKRRPGHNLALRLQKRRASVLRFLHDPSVPFTNNQAEQDLRMMKLRMKISGGFRSEQGARDFATLRSVLSTARKQGLNCIEALLHGPDALLAQVESQLSPCGPR